MVVAEEIDSLRGEDPHSVGHLEADPVVSLNSALTTPQLGA